MWIELQREIQKLVKEQNISVIVKLESNHEPWCKSYTGNKACNCNIQRRIVIEHKL